MDCTPTYGRDLAFAVTIILSWNLGMWLARQARRYRIRIEKMDDSPRRD
jgi:hypothetical protein